VRVVDPQHPVTRGLGDFVTDDELYFCLKGTAEIHLLCDAYSKVKKSPQPQAFAFEPGSGRVFLCTLGHDVEAYAAPGVRQLYRQATAWAAGLKSPNP
jgi:type 1 glutamine amidotransferase